MSVAFVDRLVEVLVRGDIEGASELLSSLQGGDMRDAKDWFAKNRRWLNSIHTMGYAGETHDERHENRREADWIVAMCALALCAPVTAARRVPWSDLWNFWQCRGEAAFVEMLREADPGWVAEFVEAASQVSLGANARNTNHTLSRVLRAAVVHHGLPCPTGRTFLKQWLAGSDVGSAVDLSRDPLMPDLLFLYLASGHCGQDAWLPEAAADVVRRGVVDRTELLEHVLGLLTAPQRTASQRVLAAITTAVDLRADEIPGGLTYLLGVLSTSNGSVGRVLLPHAIELVADREGLLELTTVVAGRPEQKQKEMLLTALKAPSMVTSVGQEGLQEALGLLASGDDSAFADKVRRAAQAVGADVASETGPDTTGLWELEPAPAVANHRPSWRQDQPPSWSQVLDSRWAVRGVEQQLLVDLTLAAMKEGRFAEGAAIRDPAVRLIGQGRLSVSRLTGALSDIFLGGGMRQAWPAAMAIADAACAAPRRPAGLS